MLRPVRYKEKRRHSRFLLDLPLEYRVTDLPDAYGGIVVNGSEFGLLIRSLIDMPIGTKLNIMVLFVDEFQLGHFDAVAKIVRKDRRKDKMEKGYEYGLRLIQMKGEDHFRMRQLLTAKGALGTEGSSGGMRVDQGGRSSP